MPTTEVKRGSPWQAKFTRPHTYHDAWPSRITAFAYLFTDKAAALVKVACLSTDHADPSLESYLGSDQWVKQSVSHALEDFTVDIEFDCNTI